MREFKDVSEETKGSFEEAIREVGDAKESSTRMDVVTHLPEEIIESSAFPEKTEKTSFPLISKKVEEAKG